MAINIPSSVFDIYNEAVLFFARPATLVYPAKREDCPNCTNSSFGVKSQSYSIYTPGGPVPFERGMPCPYCHGKGSVKTVDTISIEIKRELQKKNAKRVTLSVHPDVYKYLIEEKLLNRWSKGLRMRIKVVEDASMHVEEYKISA